MTDQKTHQYRTIPRAARETGIAEQLIRMWILQGDLNVHRNPDIVKAESSTARFVIDTVELKALAAKNKNS